MLCMRHYNIEDDQYCVLCYTTYPLAANSVKHVGGGIIAIDWDNTTDVQLKAERTRLTFNSMFYMKIFITAAWHIWKQRNSKVFENKTPNISS